MKLNIHTAVVIDRDGKTVQKMEELIEKDHLPLELIGWASSLESGLKLLEDEKPNFLFLDVILDGRNPGLEILDLWSSTRTKVILHTAHAEYHLIGVLKGVAGILPKPISRETLKYLLQDNLTTSSNSSPNRKEMT